MFDLSSGKLILIGVIALIVVGPKELPGLLRQLGRTTAKLREMAGDFRSQFDEAMREAELHEVTRELDSAASSAADSMRSALDPIDSVRSDIDQAMTGASAEAHAAVAAVDGAGPGMTLELPEPPEPPPLAITAEAQADAATGEAVAAAKPRRRRKAVEVAAEPPADEPSPAVAADPPDEQPKPRRRRKAEAGVEAAPAAANDSQPDTDEPRPARRRKAAGGDAAA